jgi:uncharacterized protein YndB with AHSA1/START domain
MDRTDTTSQVIEAPLTRVYAALVDPHALVEWLPPQGMRGHFDDRVVQAIDFQSDDPSFAGTMTLTWTVSEADGGTRVDIRADHVPPGIAAEDHAAGMTSSLSNLATYLAGPHSSQD